MRRAAAFAGLLVLAACARPECPWSSPPTLPLDLRVRAASGEVALLQPFALQVDLFVGNGQAVEFTPTPPAGTVGAVAERQEQPLGNGVWRHFTLQLAAVAGPGELVIPPYEVQGRDGAKAASAELKLQVTSRLGGAAAGLEAPGGLLAPPPRLGLPLLLAGGMLLLLVLTGLFLQRRRAAPAPAVVVPAHVKALRALGRLRSEPRATAAEIEAFYVAVSQVLRVYLEEAFALHAPERTTEEFLAELEAGAALQPAQRQELRAFLQQCDLVKFAAVLPDAAVHERTFAIAEQFVEATRPDRAAGAPGGAAA